MKNLPLVTVVIPTYNSPDLYGTLDSVLAQDYPRIQLILVDDASVSFSKSDVEEYLRRFNRGNLESILVIANSQNRGTVKTMNLALQHCRGEFQFNLAGDDCFYDPQVLTDWVAEFRRTGARVMTAYRAIYDEHLEQFSRTEPTDRQIRKIQTKKPKALFEDIAKANFIFGCCTARRREVLEQYGLYDERYRLVEDHPMNLKLLRMGEPIVFFPRIVVKYRGGGTSSPIRYNAVYRQDVDNILRNEVLPFTKHPIRAHWNNYAWKREHRLIQKRQQRLERWQGCRPMELLIYILFYLQRPLRTTEGVINRIRKRLKGDR